MLDVIVVGGGLSGLYAAHLLLEAGLSVEVVEARERLGGRLHTIHTPEGHPIDLGGQWIGPQHTRVWEWIKKHHIPTHPTYTNGHNLLLTHNRTFRYQGTIPKLPLLALIDLGQGLGRFKRMARRVSPTHPWHLTRPAWDEQSLAAWARKAFWTQTAREVFTTGIATVLGCEAEEVSLWHTLFYTQSAGSLEALIETTGGAQETKLSQGAASLLAPLIEKVPHRTNTPIRAIEWRANSVSVRTQKGDTFAARALLLAIPPAALSTIAWDPPLPPPYAQLSQHMPMGSITKVVAIYDTPFWREKGLSGHILKLHGALRITFDTSPADGSYGQITGFGVGPLARSLLHLSEEDRHAHYRQELVSLFGKAPRWFYQKTWADEPFIGGCYVGYFAPGGWRYFGRALREPLPPVFWAGTERASTWMGYMEGAMAAAEASVLALQSALSA